MCIRDRGYGVPGVLGGLGGGWLISHQGFAAAFWAAAVCGGAAWLAATRALQHSRARPQP